MSPRRHALRRRWNSTHHRRRHVWFETADLRHQYRLYDYGRPRELHIDKGLEATKLHTNAGKVVRPADANSNVLIRSPFFQVEKIRLREPLHTPMSPDTPHIVVAVSGSGVVKSQGIEPVSFATGDAVVVPACEKEYTVRPQWDIDIMRMSLPVGPVAEPQTELSQSFSRR